MESPDHWNRRRFLALAGGMTVLAGCAAEEIDDAEETDDEGDDVDEEADDEDDDAETGDDTDEPDEEADGEDDEESAGEAEGDEQDETDDEGDDTPDDAESEDGEDDHEGTDDSEEGEADSDETDDSGEDHTNEGDEDQTDEESDGGDETDGEADDGAEDDEGEDQTDDEQADEGDDGNDDTSDDEPEEPPLSDISIRIVDPDGEPIEGATVHGEGEPHEADIPLEFDGETGGSGYHHNTIYENSYTIEIDHPDYESTVIEHTHDGETEVTVELEPLVEEPPTSEITIWVVDSDGNPIEGAEIAGQGDPHEADIPLEFSGETNADGVHSTPIYENEYTIEVTHPDYDPTTVEHRHDGETEVVVELDQPGTPLTIVAIDPTTGDPMADATVAVYGDVIEPVVNPIDVDADGSVTVLIEEDSEVDVVVTDGFHPTDTPESQGVVVGSEPKTVEIEAVEWPDSCAVSVEVVDEHGEPIEGADVWAQSEPDVTHEVDYDEAVTDADGTATLEALCGSWGFEVRAEGYTDTGDWVEITDNDHRTFELELTGDDN